MRVRVRVREARIDLHRGDFARRLRVETVSNEVYKATRRDDYRPSNRTEPLGPGMAIPAVHGDSGAEAESYS